MEPVPLFDAHCHLQDDRIVSDIDGVLLRARRRGVRAMMCCGSAEDDWESVRKLSKREGIFVSFGLHPWYIDKRSSAWLDKLGALLHDLPRAGVGEIGLDHALENTDLQLQEEIFISQLRLARELRRPLSIHCRKAFGRLMEIMKSRGGVVYGGIVHSYSGPKDLVPQLERLGLSISFSGSITRSNNKRGHEAVKAVSSDRLLIETDSPDMLPVQAANAKLNRTKTEGWGGVLFGGREPCPNPAEQGELGLPEKSIPSEPSGTLAAPANEPANMVFVLEKIAQLTGETQNAIAQRTWNNACRVFLASSE